MHAAADGLLVLFDIDGTLLLRASDAHRDALLAALREVHGLHAPSASRVIDPAGRTDGEIARAILLAHDVPAERIDARALDVRHACVRAYAELCPEDLSSLVAPGVEGLLEGLSDRDEFRLALLTGNFEPVARLKLRRAGIGHFFEPGQGAFGSDGEDRAGLPAIARRRAGTAGAPHRRERTVIVGDTPLDIACARADDVGCVAVATGPYRVDDLAGADAVARSASELAPLLEERLGA
jgi:phosphoglycolate phosphatase-like HAD superfamily hydrolase